MAKAGLLFVGTDDGLVLFSDPGASGRWLRIGHELRGQQVLAVWPLFENPQIVLAGGPGGLWRSDDGGASWQQHHAELSVVAFSGAKDQPQAIDLRTADGRYLHSADGGLTWQAAAAHEVEPELRITLAGRTPVTLEAHGGDIRRSEDDGATWTNVTVDQDVSGDVSALAPARYHIDTAYAGSGSGQLLMSSDRGRTWHTIKTSLPAIRSILATRLA